MRIAVIPARNEERTIGRVVRLTRRFVDKVIVVDDASRDRTAAIARSAGARVINLRQHGGVGVATRAGLSAALRDRADVIVFLDADGQHNPSDIPKFLEKIKLGYDFVLGKRDLSGYPKRKRIGNFFLRIWASFLCPTGLADPECGFRTLTANAARKLDLRANGYAICMDFIYNVWKRKIRATQVPISVPVYHRGKGTRIRTGIWNALWLLARRLS